MMRDVAKLYNPMTINELQEKFPSIPWMEYINTLLSPYAKVDSNDVLIVKVPSYISSFEALISRTPKRSVYLFYSFNLEMGIIVLRVQANHALWRMILELVSYLTDEIRKREQQYYTVLIGTSEITPRWKECIGITTLS